MMRNEFNRGLLSALCLTAWLVGGCARGPVLYQPKNQITLDRALVESPAGFEVKQVMSNLTAPTAIAIDASDGTILVAEGGIDGDEPQIYAVKSNSTLSLIYPYDHRIPFSPVQPGFQIYGPIGGMIAEHHHVYVSHRDKQSRGVITRFGYDGSHETVVGDLPAQGDFGVTDMVIGPDERLYFGVGSATNSGIVGLDNLRWLRKHSEFCDQAFQDLELLGLRFITKNPFAGLFGGSDIVNTGPYQPFGMSNRAHIYKAANGNPTSAIYSVFLSGGDKRIEAFGIRLPRGLAFNEHNVLYVTNNGMEMRGSRPVRDDPDTLLRIFHGGPPEDFGFPDYSADLQPITDKLFRPPVTLILPGGFEKLVSVIDRHASGLRESNENMQSLVKARFPSLSGAAKLAFVPGSGPFKRWRGEAIIALSGDRAPFATSGIELKSPVGYKLVRVDVDSGKVEEFIHNTGFLPASKTGQKGIALERPIDVKIGADGAMYILDFGEVEYKPSGREKISNGTGRLLKLVPIPQPTSQP